MGEEDNFAGGRRVVVEDIGAKVLVKDIGRFLFLEKRAPGWSNLRKDGVLDDWNEPRY